MRDHPVAKSAAEFLLATGIAGRAVIAVLVGELIGVPLTVLAGWSVPWWAWVTVFDVAFVCAVFTAFHKVRVARDAARLVASRRDKFVSAANDIIRSLESCQFGTLDNANDRIAAVARIVLDQDRAVRLFRSAAADGTLTCELPLLPGESEERAWGRISLMAQTRWPEVPRLERIGPVDTAQDGVPKLLLSRETIPFLPGQAIAIIQAITRHCLAPTPDALAASPMSAESHEHR